MQQQHCWSHQPIAACLLLLLFLLQLPLSVTGVKIYKTRSEVMRMLGTENADEEKIYLELCVQSESSGDCTLAINDDLAVGEWTQCASTTPVEQPSWMARLEAPAYISRVVIHTVEQMPDAAMLNALADFALIASDAICYRHMSSVPFGMRSFPCDAFADQLLVRSYRSNSIMALCEIVIYGKTVLFQGMESGETEVGYQSCDQSTSAQGGTCDKALDRNFNQFIEKKGMCVQTLAEPELNSWWAGYFSVPTLVRHVKLFNVLNSQYKGYLSNFTIRINEKECARYEDKKSFSTKIFSCVQFGNNIKVEHTHENVPLVICQVQVFGYKMVLQADMNHKSLGCYKDNTESPDFEVLAANAFMSPRKCHRICKRRNMLYFGLQNGQVCMCGNKYGRYGKSENDTACNMPCNDNSQAFCGGRLHNSVFEILL